MEDEIFAEIIPISHPNRERFMRRRNRLIGPDGATLKAIELLTKCYILVHGKTVCAIGPYSGVVQVRRTPKNYWPVLEAAYHPCYWESGGEPMETQNVILWQLLGKVTLLICSCSGQCVKPKGKITTNGLL